MALTIESATIGYNRSEVQTAINNLNTKCIDETIQKMKDSEQSLFDAVDAIWAGKSAESFKKNIHTDRETISKGLQDTKDVITGQFNQILASVDDSDQNLVKERGE